MRAAATSALLPPIDCGVVWHTRFGGESLFHNPSATDSRPMPGVLYDG
jgi:hypothetical protein